MQNTHPGESRDPPTRRLKLLKPSRDLPTMTGSCGGTMGPALTGELFRGSDDYQR
jgi:hypothetical protein